LTSAIIVAVAVVAGRKHVEAAAVDIRARTALLPELATPAAYLPAASLRSMLTPSEAAELSKLIDSYARALQSAAVCRV
jgi:hypothetical protein